MDCTRAYREAAAKAPRFSPDEERLLWERMRDGKEARRLLIESQLSSAMKAAGKWKSWAKAKGIPFDDLVQCANEVAVQVVDDVFDPKKGRLHTILNHYIQSRLGDLVGSEDRLVRKPRYFIEDRGSDRSFQEEADATESPAVSVDNENIAFCGREPDPSAALEAADHLEYMRRVLFDRIVLLLGVGVSARDVSIFLDFAWTKRGKGAEEVGAVYGVNRQRVYNITQCVRELLKEVSA